jgi:enamine deaminase RidA (YjgF/YER057c/UK114 family)
VSLGWSCPNPGAGERLAAISVAELHFDAPVEIEVIAEIDE